MPEFAAIPITLVGIGLLFVILFAFHAGLAAWVAVGVILLVSIVAFALYALRRPRGLLPKRAPASFDEAAPAVDDGVYRVLAVIDAVTDVAELKDIAAEQNGRTTVFVVAPAISSRVARWTGDQHAYNDAEARLDAAVQTLREIGCRVDGHVAAHDPLQATDEALREFPADEIVFVRHGDPGTAWLEAGIVEAARARYHVPVRELDHATRATVER
jgi:hypothetical protein